jgi:hypothetical protein
MTEDTAVQIFAGKIPLQFWGEVKYQDIFGISHFARYSGTWNHETRTFRLDKHEAD